MHCRVTQIIMILDGYFSMKKKFLLFVVFLKHDSLGFTASTLSLVDNVASCRLRVKLDLINKSPDLPVLIYQPKLMLLNFFLKLKVWWKKNIGDRKMGQKKVKQYIKLSSVNQYLTKGFFLNFLFSICGHLEPFWALKGPDCAKMALLTNFE